MGNIVKLVFQAIATGSGFGKLLSEVKELGKKMPDLSKAAQIVGTSFGTAGAAAGRMLGMLLQGGVRGVAAEGAKLLIDQLGLFKDRTAETKEKLDKLEEASRKFYETVNSNAQKSIAKIDEETKRRNAQLDITNRMIKAELQLQKARAIADRDSKRVESIDRQIAEQDNKTAMDKAVGTERDALSKVKIAEAGLNDAQKEERKANADLAKAEAALAAASKPVLTIMQSSAGAYAMMQKKDTTQYKLAVESARKRLELVEKATDAAQKSVDAEREKWQQAKEGVKALKAEQEAADAVAAAKKIAEGKEKASADAKALKDARKAADEEIRKHNEEIEKRKKENERAAIEEEIRKNDEQRKKDLQKDIEANRQRAASLEQALGDAMERVRETHDVLGNAARMDQAGELRNERQKDITDERFNDRFTKLLTSGKIKRDANGNWKIDGRASNLDKAVLDRLNAQEKVKRAEAEAAKERQRLEKMEDYLKTISETIKTATEI